MVDEESRWARKGMLGRGDFLVIDGDRAPARLAVSVAFSAVATLGISTLGVSTLPGLSVEGLLEHANLILHSRFGASAAGAVARTGAGSGAGGVAGLPTGSFLPPHAKLIHRFLGGASTIGLVVGDTLTLGTILGDMGFAGSTLGAGIVDIGAFAANE